MAIVNNQVHNGKAANRSDVVQRSATHTRPALTKPPTGALSGKGTAPMRAGNSRAADTAHSTPSRANSASTGRLTARPCSSVVVAGSESGATGVKWGRSEERRVGEEGSGGGGGGRREGR